MLVLSRKLGEKVYVGRDITITVLEMQGGRVRIGIDAPAQVPVLRAELCVAPDVPVVATERPGREIHHAAEISQTEH